MEKEFPIDEDIDPTPPTTQRNFFQRTCSKIGPGSLRLAVINIVLCGTTGTFFWYPVIFRTYGAIPGVFVIAAIVWLTYYMSTLVYKASDHAHCNEYLTLVENFLGSRWKNVAKFTYVMDYFAVYVIGFLLSWNIFAYLLYYWGFISDAAIEDKDRLIFKDYHPRIMFLRFVVMGISLLVSIPLFLKERIDSLKYVVFAFMAVIVFNITYLIFDLRQFRAHYIHEGTYEFSETKPLTFDSFRYVLIFICAFYVQSNLLTMKTEVANPTYTRMVKSLRISHLFFLAFGLAFGFYGYYCLGDRYTNDLFMLRKTFEGKKYEQLYRMILIAMAACYILYMAFFNISLRNFIHSNFDSKPNHYLVSLGPLFLAFVLSWSYPKIVNFLGYNALIVCLLNGFMFPIMIARKIFVKEGRSRWVIHGLDALTFVLLAISAVSFGAIIYNDFFAESSGFANRL
jgi:hypothetical protein